MLVIFRGWYKLWNSVLCSSFQPHVTSSTYIHIVAYLLKARTVEPDIHNIFWKLPPPGLTHTSEWRRMESLIRINCRFSRNMSQLPGCDWKIVAIDNPRQGMKLGGFRSADVEGRRFDPHDGTMCLEEMVVNQLHAWREKGELTPSCWNDVPSRTFRGTFSNERGNVKSQRTGFHRDDSLSLLAYVSKRLQFRPESWR